jgi:hypothetical protein
MKSQKRHCDFSQSQIHREEWVDTARNHPFERRASWSLRGVLHKMSVAAHAFRNVKISVVHQTCVQKTVASNNRTNGRDRAPRHPDTIQRLFGKRTRPIVAFRDSICRRKNSANARSVHKSKRVLPVQERWSVWESAQVQRNLHWVLESSERHLIRALSKTDRMSISSEAGDIILPSNE